MAIIYGFILFVELEIFSYDRLSKMCVDIISDEQEDAPDTVRP